MAAISITAANVAASAQGTVIKNYNFGTTVTQGQTVYLDANNLWQLGNALTSAATAGALTKTGIAVSAGASGQPAAVCTFDPAFTLGGTLTAGVPVVIGSANGTINPVSDLTTGWFATIMGVPISTTQMILQPIPGGLAHA